VFGSVRRRRLAECEPPTDANTLAGVVAGAVRLMQVQVQLLRLDTANAHLSVLAATLVEGEGVRWARALGFWGLGFWGRVLRGLWASAGVCLTYVAYNENKKTVAAICTLDISCSMESVRRLGSERLAIEWMASKGSFPCLRGCA
jgi:hypothetical protein